MFVAAVLCDKLMPFCRPSFSGWIKRLNEDNFRKAVKTKLLFRDFISGAVDIQIFHFRVHLACVATLIGSKSEDVT